MTINLPKRLVLQTGHLVQIKQAANREDIRESPKWLVDRSQLEKLLEADSSATYWLLQLHHAPKVLSVPAKYLLGLFDARRRKQTTMTVVYDQVRSASTTLGSELVPLLMGLWVGVADKEVVAIAQGMDSRHVPARVIELTLSFDEPR
ncbi:hypothetical protein SD72_05600 [Leucobacter komagatae]|uniref:Uncharacterized protein n=1 Tax=Leucobacter komagatae TaxID=55969 RepID=A0A0D0IN33_9MICO|nr:hypothetical protein SD72_05600 [Leucobacter komagatae]